MLFLLELPVLLLLTPADFIGAGITGVFMVAGCIWALKKGLYKKQDFRARFCVKNCLIAIPVCLILAVSFYVNWSENEWMQSLAEMLSIPRKYLTLGIAGVLAIASMWGVTNAISVLKELDLSTEAQTRSEIENTVFARIYAIILALAVVLYAALLGGSDIWADEAYTFAMLKHTYAEIWKITAADVHPPLYYFLLKTLTMPFGYSMLSTKIVSIIPFLFILAFGGYQFKKLFDTKTGLAFMVLFLFMPFLMDYVVEIRMYSWAAAFVFGNAVYAYRCYYEDRVFNWIAFTLLGLCSAYTHYYALASTCLVYGFLFLAIVINKKKKFWPWAIVAVVTILGYIPWLKCFIEQIVYKVNNDYWIPAITIRTIIGYGAYLFGYGEHNSIALTVLLAVVYLLALVELIKSKDKKEMILCGCALAVPMITLLFGIAVSVLIRPIFVIRYIAPSAALMIVFLILALRKRARKSICVIAMAISVLAGAVSYGTIIQKEYTVYEDTLDQSFIEEHSDAQCYVLVTENKEMIKGALSYYDSEKKIFSGETYWAASPYDNLHPEGEFDSNVYDTFLIMVDVGTDVPDEYLAEYNSEYAGQIRVDEYLADVYKLTK